MPTTYCTPEDVALVIGIDGFSGNTNPTRTQVEAIINLVEDEIDSYTGHAWREKQSNLEYYEIGRLGWRHPIWTWMGYPIYLGHRKIRVPFDKAKGDVFEVFEGGQWIDWLDGTHDDSYWVDEERGIVYIKAGIWGYRWRWARIKYRYGDSTVPDAIRRACALLAAAHILESQDRWFLIPEGGTGSISADKKVQLWRQSAYQILDNYVEMLHV